MAVQIPFPLPSEGYALNSKVRINLDFLVDQFNQFNSGTATWDNVSVGTPNSLTGTVTFYNASNANYVTLRAGATSSSHTYTLPLALPASSGVLSSDNAGTLSWATTITGQFIFSAGTAGTPSLRAADNLDTGLFYATSGTTLALSHEGSRFFGKDSGGVFLEGIPNYTGSSLIYSVGGYLAELANSQGTTGIVSVSSSQTPKVIKLLGTSNQVTVTFNSDDITLALPQSIAAGSTPQFSRLQLGDGTSTNPALFFTAETDLGISRSASGTMTMYGSAGTIIASFSPTLTSIGGDLQILLGADIVFQGASFNTTIRPSSSITEAWTLTLPPDNGTSGYVLSTDGSGVTSWVSVASIGGANTALSNLASVAINTSLISDTNNTDDLGSSSIKWKDLYLAGNLVGNTATFSGGAGFGNASAPSASTLGGIDIWSGGLGIVIGADGAASTRTNNTTKIARIGCAHYTNTEEPVGLILGSMDGTDHIVNVGGGSGLVNAATNVRFYTAATTTTTSGTERLRIGSAGDLGIASGVKFYFDGVGLTGDTYVSETTGNTLAFYAGGNNALSLVGQFVTFPSSGGSGLRVYGSSGTHQWDVYLNSTNIRFSDNTSGGSVVFDTPIQIGNTVNSVSPTSPNRTVTIVIGGTTYYLHAKTTND